MEWVEMEPTDMPSDAKFDFNNINSLWYCLLDYESFLRQLIMTMANQERVEGYMNEHDPLHLVKISIIQMVCLTSFLLTTIPSLVQNI